ncbi:MAG: DUF1080 domain-containing protein [Fimbriimonadaceae bacterium]|nr:DUF1080 domain-containing protein [Fimbriimonadaceae bacterium]
MSETTVNRRDFVTRLAVGASLGVAGAAVAQAPPAATRPEPPLTPGGVYRAHDGKRPRPEVIQPGTASTAAAAGQPPSDAVVLFNGTDWSKWEVQGKPGQEPGWKIQDGYAEVVAKTGAIQTRDRFGSSQIHLEWATPAEVKGSSQGRGNSGVFFLGFGEVQVLDSYQNDTYPDGQAGAVYGKYPPLVNACRPPGEWQTYDLIIEVAQLDADKKVVRPARLSVIHNGVLLHHAVDLAGTQQDGVLQLQDHGNPVRYRNLWIRPLHTYDEHAALPPAPPAL